MPSRRCFVKKAAAGSLAAAIIPGLSDDMPEPGPKDKIRLQNNFVILFQGDSITDSGRDKQNGDYNNPASLGSGYTFLAAASLLEKYAGLNLKIYNRGISGNKVFQLAERWEKDCIGLKPDVLSILIGVNDMWHTLNGNYNGTPERYRNDYISLLERTRSALPSVRLIVCEPFAVPGIKAVDDRWYPVFYEYQKIAKEVSERFGALFVPFQRVFDSGIKRAPGSFWTGDGVHPSMAGAQLMAQAWLKHTQLT